MKSGKNHGLSKTKEYSSWQKMKSRCYNINNIEYHRYGKRGIKVCDRWIDNFEYFLIDMGSKPTPLHSIDRINVDGNYEPDNCKWSTPKEQSLNRRSNNIITYKGVSKPIGYWSELLGLKRGTIPKRIKLGWSIEKIINTPSRIKPK